MSLFNRLHLLNIVCVWTLILLHVFGLVVSNLSDFTTTRQFSRISILIMAPVKCSFVNCGNTTESHSLFRFPTNDANRLRIWINNCGNTHLTTLTTEELRNRYLCSEHFDACYLQTNAQRTMISGMSIPRHYYAEDESIVVISSSSLTGPVSPVTSSSSKEFLKVITPTKLYSRKRRFEDLVQPESSSSPTSSSQFEREMNMPTPPPKKKKVYDSCMKPKCVQTRSRLQKFIKNYRLQNSRMSRLKTKRNTANKFSSDSSRVLALMQHKQKKRKWNKEERNLSLALFYKSPASYHFMRNQGIVLPGLTTIKRWLSESDCLPGTCAAIFKQIKMKFENSSIAEKTCMVTFDEMSIMTCLEYNNKYDFIEGFEDLGNGERSNMPAKHVLVFLLRGIYINWKMPLCYFLSRTNVKAQKLQTLIKVIINKLFDAGLLPKVTVCDQISTNQSTIKALGASCDSPFFFVNGKKIFAIFDVPHCIKNIRNNWLDNNFLLEDNEVSFKDVISTYEIDSKNKSRSLLKITPAHLAPNSFQKMKVKLATQIFSHSVGSAIRTAVQTKELQSPTACNTAKFILCLNNLFDGLNSKTKYNKNPYKCGLTKTNAARAALEEGKTMLSKLKKIVVKKGVKKFTIPPSFLGLQQSVNAIIQYYDEESTGGIEYLLTNRLTQDVLENLFSVYRLKAGHNKNPSARVFRSIFRSYLTRMLIKLPGHQNCEEQESVFCDLPTNPVTDKPDTPSTSHITEVTTEAQNEEQTIPVSFQGEEPDYREMQITESVTLEQCSVTYFAGWLAKVCIEKFQCTKCNLLMIKSFDLADKLQLLILEKTYVHVGGIPSLKCPSDTFNKIIDVALTNFEELFCVLKHKINLRKTLLSSIKTTLEIDHLDAYNLFCKEHVDYALEKMIIAKIHFHCKSEKRNFIQSKQKIRLLQHK